MIATLVVFVLCVGGLFAVVASTAATRTAGKPFCTCDAEHQPPSFLDELLGARRGNGNEAIAVGNMLSIRSAQELFRESDKDGDGTLDYATLAQLGKADLVDPILASGDKMGYVYAAAAGQGKERSQHTWWATARPKCASYGRSFAINQEGVLLYSTPENPLVPNPKDGSIPAGGRALGK
jgi:hypothetical protein